MNYPATNNKIRNLPATLIVICLLLPTLAAADRQADIIWVQKSERLLHLIKDYKIIHSYPISLGQQPLGHKQREGDQRTPEGLYYIDGRNENSDFYLSLRISYPSPRDYFHAAKLNTNPGKHIMLHGEPNDSKRLSWLSSTTEQDWTAGCIALSNRNMKTVWRMANVGTPILIDP